MSYLEASGVRSTDVQVSLGQCESGCWPSLGECLGFSLGGGFLDHATNAAQAAGAAAAHAAQVGSSVWALRLRFWGPNL